MSISKSAQRNQLLASLPEASLDHLRPNLELVACPVRMVFETPNTLITHVYFPLSCVSSIIAGAGNHRIEVGMIGRDGMTGISVVLGADQSPHECFVQVPGEALVLGVSELRRAMEAHPSVQKQVLKYARTFMLQTAQTALANGRCNIEERLARWLLKSQDRLDGDDVPLTHEFLSLMLGVTRPGVTIALQTLEAASLVRNRRGCITILDRPKLQEIARNIYAPADKLQTALKPRHANAELARDPIRGWHP